MKLSKQHVLFGGLARYCRPQKRNAVSARSRARTGALHHELMYLAAHPFAVFRLLRCFTLGHQHVAVGQGIQPARMLKPTGERADAETRCRARTGITAP